MTHVLQSSDDTTYAHTVTVISVSLASLSCALSIVGSALIIGTYLSYDELRKPARSLLFWLSVTDLGTALSYSLTFVFCGGNCECRTALEKEVYGLLGIFFPVSSFLWTDCIGLYIYAATYQKTWIAPRERLFYIFHVISWGLPLLTCITIIVVKATEHRAEMELGGSATGGWCWIQQWYYDLLGGKVIEVFSYLFLMIVYVLTWKEMKRVNRRTHPQQHTQHAHTTRSPVMISPHDRTHGRAQTNTPSTSNQVSTSMLRDSQRDEIRKHLHNKSEAVNRLLFIPVVFFFLRIWGTAHMVLHSVLLSADMQHHGNNHVWKCIDQTLAFGQAVCDPLQGFCNGILFVVFVSEVRYRLCGSLQRYLGVWCLHSCAFVCCCNYCCRCCCSLCDECCVVGSNVHAYDRHAKHMEYHNNYNGNWDQHALRNNNEEVATYYAAKYQFLPQRGQEQKRQQEQNVNLMRNPALSPFMASPSISINGD